MEDGTFAVDRCSMPAEVELEGEPLCRICYAEIMSPDE